MSFHPEWLTEIDPRQREWPEALRARSAGAVSAALPGLDAARARRVVPILSLAAIAHAAAMSSITLTAARARLIAQGNVPVLRDDPQITRVAGVLAADAYAVIAAVDTLMRSLAEDVRDADALIDLAAIVATRAATSLTTELFEPLGASAVLEKRGLHTLWAASRELLAEVGALRLEQRVGAAQLAAAVPGSGSHG